MDLIVANARKGTPTSHTAISVKTAISDILIVTSVTVWQRVSPHKSVTKPQGCVIVNLKELEGHNVTVARHTTLTILCVRRMW